MTSKNPKTVVIATRADARSLATVATAFTEKRIPIKSRSHLNYLIIETFCESLVRGNVVARVESTDEAVRILTSIGINFEESLQRNVKALARQISSEQAIEEATTMPQTIVPQSKVDEALEKFRMLDSENKQGE